jgi:hypothetical protein
VKVKIDRRLELTLTRIELRNVEWLRHGQRIPA